MKLLRLTMSNLASLEGEQVIPFDEEPLKSADLFSIVGETGSGKSTLLDAVCLALYGRAPRFQSAVNYDYYASEKPNTNRELMPADPRNILRRGAKSCFAEVLFRANDGELYRAWWSCGFARKNFTSVSRRLFRLCPDGEGRYTETELDVAGGESRHGVYKVANKGLDAIIGLDYEQFTRTVMLAQNSFANFIRATDKEKALLLERLTGTEIYTSVARKIYEYYKVAETSYAELQHEVGAIAGQLLSDEDLSAKKEELARLETEWKEAGRLLQQVKDGCKWYADEALLLQQLEMEGKALKEAEEALAELAPLQQKIRLYQSLVPVREDYVSYVRGMQEIADNQRAYREKNEQLETMVRQDEELVQQHRKLDEQLVQLKTDVENRNHLIREARTLKVELEGLLQVETDGRKELNDMSLQLSRLKEELSETSRQLALSEKSLRSSSEIIGQMEPLRPMLEGLSVILKRLDDVCQERIRTATEQRELMSLRRALEEQRNSVMTLENQYRVAETEQIQIRKALQGMVDRCRTVDVEQVQQQYNRATVEYKDMMRLKEICSQVRELDNEISRRRTLVQKQQQDLLRLSATLQALQEERQNINAVLPGMQEAYRLTVGKTAESLRHSLQPGERCPVCGATDHPYATQLSDILSPLKKDIEAKTRRENELMQLLEHPETGLILQVSRLTAQREANEQALADALQRVEVLRTEGQKLADMYREQIDIWAVDSMEQKEILLSERLKRITSDGQKAGTLLKQYKEWTDEQIRLQTSADRQQELLAGLQSKLFTLRTEEQRMCAGLQQREEMLQKALAQSEQELAELDEVILLPRWRNLFDTDFPMLKKELTGMQNRLNDALAKRQQAEADRDRQNVTLGSLEKQTGSLQVQHDERLRKVAEIHAMVVAKQSALHELLGGLDPDKLEQQLKQRVATEEAAFKASEERLHRHHLQVAALRENCTLLDRQGKQLQQQQERLHQTVYSFLNSYNEAHDGMLPLGMDQLKEALQMEQEIPGWQQQLDEASRKAIALKGGVEVRHKNLEQHRRQEGRPSVPEEDLLHILQNQEEQTQKLDRERQYIASLILTHQRNLERISGYQEELEQKKRNWSNWKELNDILGNANGDKFRETAQCFTLHFLILQANAQLRMLNKRYTLVQVKDSLGIRVIDHDRADEMRNLSSLSGGETFLISLSLALGLSALSSRNVRIANLFVDEGFGTLDSASLNLVIDALSNLQSMQGKKVGVISHTTEMKERIATQIKVVKSGTGGKSHIEIV